MLVMATVFHGSLANHFVPSVPQDINVAIAQSFENVPIIHMIHIDDNNCTVACPATGSYNN